MFKILPYIITAIDDYAVIQNAQNTVVVKSIPLIEFFKKYDSETHLYFSKEDLKMIFIDEADIIIKFMIDNKLLRLESPRNISYKKVIFCSNDSTFIESAKFNLNSRDTVMEFISLNELIECELLPDADSLYIVFLNPFNINVLSKVVDSLNCMNALMKVGFYYNNMIYASNYYKREWNNPCPKCFFSNLEGTLRGRSKGTKTVSFATLMDLIYKKEPLFNIHAKLENNDLLPLIDILNDDLRSDQNSQANLVNMIDFNKRIVWTDKAIYWEVCSCYE